METNELGSTTTTTTAIPMLFISMADFKIKTGSTTIDLVKNPKTGKLFANVGNKNFRVEQKINLQQTIRYMYEADKFDDGCLVSVPESNNIVATL